MAYGLIKDIKGYNIHLCSIFNSPIEKSYDGCIVSPFVVAGRLPNLAMLSSRPLSWPGAPPCVCLQGRFDPNKSTFPVMRDEFTRRGETVMQ